MRQGDEEDITVSDRHVLVTKSRKARVRVHLRLTLILIQMRKRIHPEKEGVDMLPDERVEQEILNIVDVKVGS